MNKENQRIAIAKACGHLFKKTNLCSYCHGNTPYEAGDDYGITLYEECKHCNNTGKVKSYYVGLRDYVGDLNIMHEAEKTLKEKKLFFKYHLALSALPQFQGNNHLNTFHATAAQRAEAFLRTLNLWE